ncbi:hypothetical protein ACFL23_04915 [Patescibacteria group bacterium]
MITIFTIPKPFTEPHIKIIQQNAIKSWALLNPKCEFFLVGNDEGATETAKQLGIKNLPNVEKNEFGTPLLNSAFNLARTNSTNDIIVYLNCDIILTSNFIGAVNRLPQKNFLAVGRRWDLDIRDIINFKNPAWEMDIKKEIKKRGVLHSYAGIDYFIFEKNSFKNMPPLIVGRVGWDNYMILKARNKKMKVIDATEAITAIHQNHDYPNFNKGRERKTNPEAKKNSSFIKSVPYTFTIEDTNYKLTKNELKRKFFYWIPFVKRYIKYKINSNP